MYDKLWEESPRVQRTRTESKIEEAQRMLILFVKLRFPDLTELAEQELPRINNLDKLDLLTEKIYTAPDEATVRWLLTPAAA